MKTTQTPSTVSSLALCLLALPIVASAATTTWTGTTNNDFNTGTNWSGGLPSGADPTPVIALDGADVTMSNSVSVRSTLISGNGATAPKLTITENYTNAFSFFQVGSDATGSGYSGEVVHTSGTLAINGGSGARRLYLAHGATGSTSGNFGTYTFGGASATAPVLAVTDQIFMGTRPGETGTLTLQDHGTISSGLVFQMGQFNGDATLNVVGGNLSINLATGVSAGTNGFTMSPSGAGTTTLNATIDATGFSTINVGGDAQLGLSVANNDSIFNLSLGVGFTPTVGTKYDIMSITGSFTGGGAFGNVADGDIITVGGNDFEADYTSGVFSVTAIPEPNSASLLVGIGALCLLFRRRR